ncbi:glycoside hydrolase family 19 protein [Campylobacter sputorum]|uniref:glycoside hydrolase family 19 protein n=1 Tax=Campylobacter sputorum TaxID=206 RepID=UPI001E622CCA|nr:glycoside hydrolase family 19 protein [Campylobacter sputorum]
MVVLKLQLLVSLLLAAAVLIAAQNCGCAIDLCCSKYGYCGTGDPYCGDGCQSGPCYSPKRSSNGGVSVSDVVTQQFFDGIIGQAPADCTGRGFYTRQAFLDAAGKYSGFGQQATIDNSKREIAAFFAHVAHDTGRFCYKEHKDKPNYLCDNNSPQYTCTPEQKNYGREPLRFFWNYNNGLAGHDIGFHSPKSLDATVTFETALGFWMKNVHNVLGEGFGATIKAVHGQRECNSTNMLQVNNRISLYKDYCRQFGVFPGDNLTC